MKKVGVICLILQFSITLFSESFYNWEVSKKTDPIDDAVIITALNKATEVTGTINDAIYLAIKRQGNATSLYISFNDYLGDNSKIITRIDAGTAQERSWAPSSDSTALFFPSEPTPFISELSDSNRLVVRVTPYREAPVTAIFQLAGLSEFLEEYSDYLNPVEQKDISIEQNEIALILNLDHNSSLSLIFNRQNSIFFASITDSLSKYRSLDEVLIVFNERKWLFRESDRYPFGYKRDRVAGNKNIINFEITGGSAGVLIYRAEVTGLKVLDIMSGFESIEVSFSNDDSVLIEQTNDITENVKLFLDKIQEFTTKN